ncbi:MAG: hypothetical protein JO215_13940, partial [Ktedonobacteraceae bacterium]|nr:hypothetical protein [Ktedonobacteraceae bacterium]
RINDDSELDALHIVVEWHARKTHSKYAEQILEQWDSMQRLFWRIQPHGTSTSARDFVDSGEYDAQLMSAFH